MTNILVIILGFLAVSEARDYIIGIRLVDGEVSHAGNVQVKTNDASSGWSFVCDDGFEFAEADAVCRQLGFEGADHYTKNDRFGSISLEARRSSTPNFFQFRLDCSSTDSANYSLCPTANQSRHDCAVMEVAGVRCRTLKSVCELDQFPCQDEGCVPRENVCDCTNHCSDGSDEMPDLCTDMTAIRLYNNRKINIPDAIFGNVQVKKEDRWGTICDDVSSQNESKVICRSLGYKKGWAAAFAGSYFDTSKAPMISDTNLCNGYEEWYFQCDEYKGFSRICDEIEGFGVFCYDKDVEVKLSGEESPRKGQVQLKLSGKWGSICDSGFDVFDAQVICRILGSYGDATIYRQAGKSQTGLIWTLKLDCLGHEEDLQECRLRFDEGICPTSNTAGVSCSQSRGRTDKALRSALGNPDCGLPEDTSNIFITGMTKVIGGAILSQFNYPWLVTLRLKNKMPKDLHCGGSIISEDYVITAAHCLIDLGKLNVIIRVGDYDSNVREEFEEEFSIEKIWVHEHYEEETTFDNDIALVKIKRKYGRGFRFGPGVKPICLPSVYDNYDDLVQCTVSGWGPNFQIADPQSLPREGAVYIIPDYICEGNVAGGLKNFSSSIFCGGNFKPRVNACNGDSGGPLSCSVDGRQILFGLVSSGSGCDNQRVAVDFYTRVTKYLNWILDKVQTWSP